MGISKVIENDIEYSVEVGKNKAYTWVYDGVLHREDGPAIEYANGDKWWYRHGQLHREVGPAIEFANGTKYWYRNGQNHREDGPAIENADGTRFWYLNNELLDITSDEQFYRLMNLKAIM